MRKQLKRKKRSFSLCKPHKMGIEKRWTARDAARLKESEREVLGGIGGAGYFQWVKSAPWRSRAGEDARPTSPRLFFDGEAGLLPCAPAAVQRDRVRVAHLLERIGG